LDSNRVKTEAHILSNHIQEARVKFLVLFHVTFVLFNECLLNGYIKDSIGNSPPKWFQHNLPGSNTYVLLGPPERKFSCFPNPPPQQLGTQFKKCEPLHWGGGVLVCFIPYICVHPFSPCNVWEKWNSHQHTDLTVDPMHGTDPIQTPTHFPQL
jgi:hypothetical protein